MLTNIAINKKSTFEYPKPLPLKIKLGDILEKNIDPKYSLSDTLWAGHQRCKEQHKSKGNGFDYSRFNEFSQYTNTISARYYKDGSEILINQGEGKKPRKITPREAAGLQGFPEDFKIVVSDVQAYKKFGNSVCVPVIRAIAQQLKPYLLDNTPTTSISPQYRLF